MKTSPSRVKTDATAAAMLTSLAAASLTFTSCFPVRVFLWFLWWSLRVAISSLLHNNWKGCWLAAQRCRLPINASDGNLARWTREETDRASAVIILACANRFSLPPGRVTICLSLPTCPHCAAPVTTVTAVFTMRVCRMPEAAPELASDNPHCERFVEKGDVRTTAASGCSKKTEPRLLTWKYCYFFSFPQLDKKKQKKEKIKAVLMYSARRSDVVNNGLGSVWDVQLCIVGAWTESTLGKNRNSSEILILHKAHRVITWFFSCLYLYMNLIHLEIIGKITR